MTDQVAVIPAPAEAQNLVTFLQIRRDAAITELQGIQTITTDEEYASAEAILSTAKALYEKMYAKRKAFTDPIKKFIEEQIMPYENALNPAATKENDYLRARKVLEAYNQEKIKAKQALEHEAWVRSEQIKYKAEFKAKVQEQLQNMLSGKHRSLIDGMANWEKGLTLENIDEKEKGMRDQQPVLKQPDYDACFHRWGQRPDVLAPASEDEYLEEIKKELTYKLYNEKFQQIVAPIKNEYLAKIPSIKVRLQEMAKASSEKAEQLRKANEAKLEAEKNEKLRLAAEHDNQEKQAIQDNKELGVMEGDFTAQAMTSDVDAGPSKMVYGFENDMMWLNPLVHVISKCAVNPKFKGIKNGKGEYVPEVQKWLTFYGDHIAQPLAGLKGEEVAKTIVKKR